MLPGRAAMVAAMEAAMEDLVCMEDTVVDTKDKELMVLLLVVTPEELELMVLVLTPSIIQSML